MWDLSVPSVQGEDSRSFVANGVVVHNCPWVNNCVAIFNQKFFVLFLLYTSLCCLYAGTLLVARFISCTRNMRQCSITPAADGPVHRQLCRGAGVRSVLPHHDVRPAVRYPGQHARHPTLCKTVRASNAAATTP